MIVLRPSAAVKRRSPWCLLACSLRIMPRPHGLQTRQREPGVHSRHARHHNGRHHPFNLGSVARRQHRQAFRRPPMDTTEETEEHCFRLIRSRPGQAPRSSKTGPRPVLRCGTVTSPSSRRAACAAGPTRARDRSSRGTCRRSSGVKHRNSSTAVGTTGSRGRRTQAWPRARQA